MPRGTPNISTSIGSRLKAALRNKLLLPILGNQYGTELESKHIQVSIEDGRPLVHYYDHTMPIAPRTVHLIFDQNDALAPAAIFS